jgi:hypothetical protein
MFVSEDFDETPAAVGGSPGVTPNKTKGRRKSVDDEMGKYFSLGESKGPTDMGAKKREQLEDDRQRKTEEARLTAKEERRLALNEADQLKREARERAALLSDPEKRPKEDSSKIWLLPSWENAEKLRQATVFGHATSSIFSTGQWEMREMGPGVTLYFSMLELLMAYFTVCTVLFAIPAILVNQAGSGTPDSQADIFGFAVTMLGNQGVVVAAKPLGYCLQNEDMLGCANGTMIEAFGQKFESRNLGLGLMVADLLQIALFLMMIQEFKKRIDTKIMESESDVITASNFSVMVTRLPPDTTEEEILEHFSSRYSCGEDGWTYYPLNCFGCCGTPKEYVGTSYGGRYNNGAPDPEPVTNIQHFGDDVDRAANYKHGWVASVSVAHPLGSQIKAYFNNADALQELNEAQREVLKYSEGSEFELKVLKKAKLLDENGAEIAGLDGQRETKRTELRTLKRVAAKKVREIKITIAAFEKQIVGQEVRRQSVIKGKDGRDARRMDAKGKRVITTPLDVCVGAFIVFNNEESQAVCLDNYQTSRSWLGRWLQPVALRFKDREGDFHPIEVRRAPEPEDIVWENLEYTPTQRGRFRNRSRGITALVICISFVFILAAEIAGGSTSAQMDMLPLCSQTLPSNYFGAPQLVPSGAKPEWFPDRDAECPAGKNYVTYWAYNESQSKSLEGYSEAFRKENIQKIAPPPHAFEPFPDTTTISENGKKYATAPEGSSEHRTEEEVYRWLPPGNPFTRSGVGASMVPASGGFRFDMQGVGRMGLHDNPNSSMYSPGMEAPNVDLCTDPCVDLSTDATLEDCGTLPCAIPAYEKLLGMDCEEYGKSVVGLCFCNDVMEDAMEEQPNMIRALLTVMDETPICTPFVKNYVLSSVLGMTAVFMIVIVNYVLETIMESLTEAECHPSLSDKTASLSFKIFVSMFINTALVILMVNWKALGGDFVSYSRGWYGSVGVDVAVTMLFNIFEPNVMPFFELLSARVGRWLTIRRDKVTSQNHMNQMYSAPEMPMESKYPTVLNTVFVTLFFSAGIPILIPMAGAFVALTYVCDKYMLLRVNKKPYYDAALATDTLATLPYAMILHLGNAVWFFGHNDLLQSYTLAGAAGGAGGRGGGAAGQTVRDYQKLTENLSKLDPFGDEGMAIKLVRVNCLPLILLLGVYFVWSILPDQAKAMPRRVWRAYQNLSCDPSDWVQMCKGLFRGEDDLEEDSKERFPQNWPARVADRMAKDPFSPYTGDYQRLMQEGARGPSLQQMSIGWKVDKATLSSKDKARLRKRNQRRRKKGDDLKDPAVLVRNWQADGVHAAGDGSGFLETDVSMVQHERGQRMRTWKAMTSIPSYNILAHPTYRSALGKSVYFKKGAKRKVTKMVRNAQRENATKQREAEIAAKLRGTPKAGTDDLSARFKNRDDNGTGGYVSEEPKSKSGADPMAVDRRASFTAFAAFDAMEVVREDAAKDKPVKGGSLAGQLSGMASRGTPKKGKVHPK